jgi:hypothetical protein
MQQQQQQISFETVKKINNYVREKNFLYFSHSSKKFRREFV